MPKQKNANKGIVLIKKSNNLIESRYGFDIWETRFFLSILSQIRREDEEFKVHRIWYKDVIKTFGLKSGDSYALLRNAAQSLMGKSFFVSYEDDGILREKQYHILREIDYLKEGQEGRAVQNHEYLDVTIEQKMKPLLLQLQRNFTAYDLRNIVKLGVYPVRVYELLKQYQNIGHRTLKVNEMKVMFELVGKYKSFGDFYRWIIQPAVKQINKYTDLTITHIEKIKEGRRVTALRFIFQLKNPESIREAHGGGVKRLAENQVNAPSTSRYQEATGLFEEFEEVVVQSFGVTPSVFLKILQTGKYDKTQISQAISVTRRAKYNQEITKNIAGFFLKALKGGYTDPKEEAKKKARRIKEKKEAERRMKQEIEQLIMERDQQIHDRIREVTTMNPSATTDAIRAIQVSSAFLVSEKEARLGRALEIEDFRQDKVLREMVKAKIIELQNPHFEDILRNFEERIMQVKEKSMTHPL